MAPFGPALLECARLLDDIAQAEVNREAGRRLLTPALVRLLPHLSRTGVRPTELARRVDVSKQAVGQSVQELLAMKCVELVPDPADGRARLVRLTATGEAAYGHGRAVLAFYESALTSRLGRPRMTALREGLTAVLAVLEEWSRDGAPVRAEVPAGRGLPPGRRTAPVRRNPRR
jgi:DNA-binding MarR family transcriptional regulator